MAILRAPVWLCAHIDLNPYHVVIYVVVQPASKRALRAFACIGQYQTAVSVLSPATPRP